ncbi:hypothetical protein H4R19_004570 [Coemansia spiralis]|nr:hypothetical protein H4R19_004570 [Coemansia spiralis]
MKFARCNYTAETAASIGPLMDLYKVDRSFPGLQVMVSKLNDNLPGNAGSAPLLRAHFLRLASEAGDNFGTNLESMIIAFYPYVTTYRDCLVPPLFTTIDAPPLHSAIPRKR